MEYSRELVADYASRTLSNLDILQEQDRNGVAGIYPVTQLWNSLLGLLVLPYERELRKIPQTPLHDLSGWPTIAPTVGESKDLRQLIRQLRNAVAHFNVDFISHAGEISVVRVRNHARGIAGSDQRQNRVLWELDLDLLTVEALARRTAALYVEQFKAAA